MSDHDEVPPVYLLSPCMRSRLGALSKSVFSGYLAIKTPRQHLLSKTKASLGVSPSRGSRVHIETNFEVIFWQPSSSVGLSLFGMALCVGDCAVCESQPPSGGSAHCFQPPLGCTTTLLFNGSSSDFCVNTQI